MAEQFEPSAEHLDVLLSREQQEAFAWFGEWCTRPEAELEAVLRARPMEVAAEGLASEDPLDAARLVAEAKRLHKAQGEFLDRLVESVARKADAATNNVSAVQRAMGRKSQGSFHGLARKPESEVKERGRFGYTLSDLHDLAQAVLVNDQWLDDFLDNRRFNDPLHGAQGTPPRGASSTE
jgi:hypothetical protein